MLWSNPMDARPASGLNLAHTQCAPHAVKNVQTAAAHGSPLAHEKGGKDKLKETAEKAREDAAQLEGMASSFLDLAFRRVGDLVAKYGRALSVAPRPPFVRR